MTTAAKEFYQDDSYLRKFVMPFLGSRVHFGVRDYGSVLHLEGFVQLPDGREEDFDGIYTVDKETGDFQANQGFIDYINRLGEGDFVKAHGISGALLGGNLSVLGRIFDIFCRILMVFTTFGLLARGTTGLVLMLLPYALAAALIIQAGAAVATVLCVLFGFWAILGIARRVSRADAQRKVKTAIDDLAASIGLKIVDLVRLPHSDIAVQTTKLIGDRSNGKNLCMPILRAVHATDFVIGIEMRGNKGVRGPLAAVELVAAAMPRYPTQDFQAKISDEITRCLDMYPAQLEPPMLPHQGVRISAMIYLMKPDGTTFDLGTHLVRLGLAMPNIDAVSRALAATPGMQGERAEECLRKIREAEIEAKRAERGIWAAPTPTGKEPVHKEDDEAAEDELFVRNVLGTRR